MTPFNKNLWVLPQIAKNTGIFGRSSFTILQCHISSYTCTVLPVVVITGT